ncbi:MAG: hypothetical protein R2752_04495 [Vicinamibacterales bacterium]
MPNVTAAFLALALAIPPLQAQQASSAPPEVSAELSAMRRSLDQIVQLLQQLVQQTARRDTASLLMGRIEMAERRLAPQMDQMRQLRADRQAQEGEREKYQGMSASVDAMERADRSGMNVDAFAAERRRVSAGIAAAEARIAGIDGQIAELERDIAARRQAIDTMDAQLSQLLSGG